jgi:radical SAM protein with 4Fe4S-binding SPASM domain
MCFYYESLNNKSSEISIDEYRKLAKTMDPFFWLLISGGEPFLRKDLAKICQVFCENNAVRNITIPTNGWYTDKIIETVKEILETNPKVNLNVMVSLEGISDLHDEITAIKGSFERALITIDKLNQLTKEYKNFTLGTALAYSHYNQNHFVELIDYLINLKKFSSITASLTRGNPKEKTSLNYNVGNFIIGMNKVLDYYQDRKLGYAQKGFDLFSRIYFLLYRDAINISRTNKWKNPCYAGISNVVIVPNGDLFPCELLSDKFGNLRDVNFDFNKLWYNQAGAEIREKIKKTNCRCFHTCYTTTNVIFNPKRMLGVVFDSISRQLGLSKKWYLR